MTSRDVIFCVRSKDRYFIFIITYGHLLHTPFLVRFYAVCVFACIRVYFPILCFPRLKPNFRGYIMNGERNAAERCL